MAAFVIGLAFVVGAIMVGAIAKLWFSDADPESGRLRLE